MQTRNLSRIHPPPPCLPCLQPQSLPIRMVMASRSAWPCTPTPIKIWKKVTFPWMKVKNFGSWMKTVMGGHMCGVAMPILPIRIMEMKDLFRPLGFVWFEASMSVKMGLKPLDFQRKYSNDFCEVQNCLIRIALNIIDFVVFHATFKKCTHNSIIVPLIH